MRIFIQALFLTRIELAGIIFVSVILVTDSVPGQFVLTPVPSLPAVASGSVAWGDYDNDGWQDFLLSGIFYAFTEAQYRQWVHQKQRPRCPAIYGCSGVTTR